MSRSSIAWSAAAAASIFAAAAVAYGISSASSGKGALESRLVEVGERLAAFEASAGRRLDRIEASLRAPRGGSRREEPAEAGDGSDPDRGEAREGEDEPEAGDSLTEVESRVAALEQRIEGLEEDPLRRGYAFLSSESAELRREGIRGLMRVARFDPEARAAIRRALGDANARVRREALEALGDIRGKESVPEMMELLADQDAAVRRMAIEALGECEAAEAGLAVAQHLADQDERIREAAADVLGNLKSSEAGELLRSALKDPSEDVRGEAIASLGEAGVKSAVPDLRRMYDEGAGGGRNRMRLVLALRRLGDEAPFRQEVERLSRTALGDPDERARSRALRDLASFARGEARPVFTRALEDPSTLVRREAERILR
jgi:HEAT repeat protein